MITVRGKIPTVNLAYRMMQGRMVKTPAAKAYAKMVAAEYRAQGGKKIDGAWSVKAMFTIWGRRDLDNCLKVFLDAIKDAIGSDDKNCLSIQCWKASHRTPSGEIDRVEFEVTKEEA